MAVRSVSTGHFCQEGRQPAPAGSMYVIGLTGGIGSGKSTVAQMLEGKGAALLSADAVGHEVYLPDQPAWWERWPACSAAPDRTSVLTLKD